MKSLPRFALVLGSLLLTRLGLACLLVVSALAPSHGANTFESTGALAAPRNAHTATLLPSGKVLVVGGINAGIAFATATLYDPATGAWTATGSFTTARYFHTATVLPNGKVLVAGGFNGGALASAALYDPGTGLWTNTGSLGTGRSAHTATLLPNGKVLVAGGNNGSALASAELYDPATGSWTATGNLATARDAHTTTLLPNGRLLVVGGSNGSTRFASAELYDPAGNGGVGSWTATSPLGSARAQHTATLLPNGKVLAAGGLAVDGTHLASAELYDWSTGLWSTAGALATARRVHSASLLPNGKLLVAGGLTAGGASLASAEVYNPATNAWSATGALGTARYNHTATLLPSGKLLVAAGVTTGGVYLASAQLYDPAISSWNPTGNLVTYHYLHTATLLPNGKVLVAGGKYSDVNNFTIATAQLYDPSTGSWSVTGSLVVGRFSHTATLLPNGKVLVAGGWNGTAPTATAELYDPATGVWSATGSMVTGRDSPTATLLPNGRVLVAGGTPSVSSAELYDSTTGSWSATGSLLTGRSAHTATLIPNGKVLIAGGGGDLASAELYDPATGLWTATGALAEGRYYHRATLLPSGKVLVAAGYKNPVVLTSAELYDPGTGTWSPTGSMLNPHFLHSATLLPTGKVLVAGSGATSAESYDPAPGTWSVGPSLSQPRFNHTATLLANGKVLVAGGYSGAALTSAELFDAGLGFTPAWQPQISAVSLDLGGRLVLAGSGFRGISSASGGNGAQDSPTNHPVVQMRRLDNEQTVFLLPDPATNVSATAFTSVPVPPFPGHVLVTVFANGIPSGAVLVGYPDIAVEQPAGSPVADGGTRSFVATLGTPGSLAFTIRNPSNASLTGLSITKDGANAADFTVTASPTAPVPPGGSTTFTIEFAPATTGAKSAALHIASNVAAKNPYDINLTGQTLSFTSDGDGDGMSDASEFQMSALGFNWQVSQPGLVNTYAASANGAGYFTPSQVQALNVGVPLIQRNPATGVFKLTIGVKKTTNLSLPFIDFPMNAPGTSAILNGSGKLEFEFTVPGNAAFFRLESQ